MKDKVLFPTLAHAKWVSGKPQIERSTKEKTHTTDACIKLSTSALTDVAFAAGEEPSGSSRNLGGQPRVTILEEGEFDHCIKLEKLAGFRRFVLMVGGFSLVEKRCLLRRKMSIFFVLRHD